MAEPPSPTRQLATLGGSLDEVLEQVRLPAYLIDAHGVIQWLNGAARRLVGDETGHRFLEVVVPEDRVRATEVFNEKILGERDATEIRLEVRSPSGRSTPVEISSIAVRARGHMPIGVFGLATPRARPMPQSRRPPHLTPRQRETLMLLGEGASTEMIAEHLGVARETARNHIRAVLRELGARTRLEAVVEAHARGLL